MFARILNHYYCQKCETKTPHVFYNVLRGDSGTFYKCIYCGTKIFPEDIEHSKIRE